MNALEELRKYTTVVADSGDIEAAKIYKPQDATTNPSLILLAAKLPSYSPLVQDAVNYAIEKGGGSSSSALDKIIVNFGAEYLNFIPGRVSTEVDARLSHDTEGTIAKARQLIRLYQDMGISKDRILIKIAATWEGIQAARVLESEYGIHCNMTLVFHLCQAIACAEAGATLISPFVGRILDWYKKATGQEYSPDQDPGVLSVKEIFYFFKKFGFHTTVMGASFRNVHEILELVGIDVLTISPKLLSELQGLPAEQVQIKLKADDCLSMNIEKVSYIGDHELFQSHLDSNPMASQLLADGIRRFDDDAISLESWLNSLIETSIANKQEA